jgi:hypothetical protein
LFRRSRDYVSPTIAVGGVAGLPVGAVALGPAIGIAVLVVSMILAAAVRFGPKLLRHLEVTKRDGLMHGLATDALRQGSTVDISTRELQIHIESTDATAQRLPDQEVKHVS